MQDDGTDRDDPAVHRTQPESAADEGYPIAADHARARLVATIAQQAIEAGPPGRDDAEIQVLAERFVAEHADATTEAFLDWLAATGTEG
jgi:hypothetical protein